MILSYTTATADLTSIGGPADQTVINGVVQEIDIATGKVLFQWNSQDHVPYSQSEQPLPASASTPWDWFHINAVKLDTNGNLLIDARDTWTTYEVNPHDGSIIWQLGGKDSSFKLQAAPGQTLDSAGEIFAWQHDPEALGNGTYTFFDNDSAGTPLLAYSRAITVRLDQRGKSPPWWPPRTSPRASRRRRRATPRRHPRATRSSGGVHCPTSRSQPVRQSRLQRRVPGRREHLPRLPVPVAAKPRLGWLHRSVAKADGPGARGDSALGMRSARIPGRAATAGTGAAGALASGVAPAA